MFARTHRTASHASQPTVIQALESRRLMAADLVVQSIEITDGLHTSTLEETSATITVKNIGNSTALPGAELRMRFSVDDVWGNADDLILDYGSMSTFLGPGQTWTYNTSQRATNQPAGSYRLLAWIDGFSDVPESNEDNNILASALGSVTYASGELASTDIIGTTGNDVIDIRHAGGTAFVTVNGVAKYKNFSDFDHLFVDAGQGNDIITVSPDFPKRVQATGSSGKDLIVGGAGNDELSGGTGMDRVFGGAGNDLLIGGAQGDRLYGEAGNDELSGAGGNDFAYGGEGVNTVRGGAGNDKLFTKGNGQADSLSGNDGDDLAEVDANDLLAGIETTV